jgi:rare lipoprotein A
MEENQIKKLKLNVTNIRSVLISSNKELKKLKTEKNNLITSQIKKENQKSKEERLENKVTGLSSLKNIGKSIMSGPMSLFDKVMEFAGVILLGILVNNLPTIISNIKTFFSENAWWINGIIDIGKFIGKSISGLISIMSGTDMSGTEAGRKKIDGQLQQLKSTLGDIEGKKKQLDDALSGKGGKNAPAKMSLLGDLPKPVKKAKGGPVSQRSGTTKTQSSRTSGGTVTESGRVKRARQTTNYFGTFNESIKVAKETSTLDEKNLESFKEVSDNMKDFFKNLTSVTPAIFGPPGSSDPGPGAGIGIPVDPNEVVGKAGTTGLSTGVHIHFEHLGTDKTYLPSQVRDNIFVGGRKLSDWTKTSDAGMRLHPILKVMKYHSGEDWGGMPLGAPITLGPGLKYVNYTSSSHGYGNSIIIEDNDGKRYRLAHLDSGPVNLAALKAKQASSQQIASNFIVNQTIKGKQASWYGPGFYGKTTASGEVYLGNEMTAAHPTLPFGTFVRVTNLNNSKSVIVRINDRGPFEPDLVTPHKTRIIDLSKAAADHIGITGVAPVNFEVLTPKAKITPTPPNKNSPSPIFNWKQSSSSTEGSTTVLTAFVPVEKYIPYGIPQIIERKVSTSSAAPTLSALWGQGA